MANFSDEPIDFPTVSFTTGSVTTSPVPDVRVRIVTFYLGRFEQLSLGEMWSYLQMEYHVEVSQRQHSLYQIRPKETCFTNFFFMYSWQRVMPLIQYTLVTFLFAQGKWKRSLQSDNTSLKFYIHSLDFWLTKLKFTIFMFPNGICLKYHAIHSYINISIWTTNFVVGDLTFLKTIK